MLPVLPLIVAYLKQSEKRSYIACQILGLYVNQLARIFSEDFEKKQLYFTKLAKLDLTSYLLQVLQQTI